MVFVYIELMVILKSTFLVDNVHNVWFVFQGMYNFQLANLQKTQHTHVYLVYVISMTCPFKCVHGYINIYDEMKDRARCVINEEVLKILKRRSAGMVAETRKSSLVSLTRQ